MNSIQILEKLISFDTVSSNSNLELISYCEKLLKDAGVVDAGAAGYVDMIKGMLHYIEHEKIMNEDIIDNIQTDTSSEVNINEEYENSKFHQFNAYKGMYNPHATNMNLDLAKHQLQKNPLAHSLS